jgi:methyl-accepting chemotaxis protein
MIGIDDPHGKVHEAGALINQLMIEGGSNWEAEAWQVYNEVAIPNMKMTLDYLVRMERSVGTAFSVQEEMLKQALEVNNVNFDKAIALIDDMVAVNQKAVSAGVAQSVLWMLIFTLAGVAVSIFLGLIISRAIKQPLQALLKASEKIADGDLNVHIQSTTDDEIGQLAGSFSHMADKVNHVLTEINMAAEQVSAGAHQMADSSQLLSQGATEQASAVEQITASLEQLSAQTSHNANNAVNASSITNQAMKDALLGNQRMSEMLVSMEDINESSKRISKVIKVIDDIAFQTNILALNAAVEAARAGQHGKGFAVVADEVRSLAARSANAAKETAEMIEGSIRKVGAGSQLAQDTAKALQNIEKEVSRAAKLVGDIAAASNEQAAGIEQVNRAISQVSEVTQTNSATSEEAAASSEELSSQAQMLKFSVNQFRLKTGEADYEIKAEKVEDTGQQTPKKKKFAFKGLKAAAKRLASAVKGLFKKRDQGKGRKAA